MQMVVSDVTEEGGLKAFFGKVLPVHGEDLFEAGVRDRHIGAELGDGWMRFAERI